MVASPTSGGSARLAGVEMTAFPPQREVASPNNGGNNSPRVQPTDSRGFPRAQAYSKPGYDGSKYSQGREQANGCSDRPAPYSDTMAAAAAVVDASGFPMQATAAAIEVSGRPNPPNHRRELDYRAADQGGRGADDRGRPPPRENPGRGMPTAKLDVSTGNVVYEVDSVEMLASEVPRGSTPVPSLAPPTPRGGDAPPTPRGVSSSPLQRMAVGSSEVSTSRRGDDRDE